MKVGDVFELRVRRFFRDGAETSMPSTILIFRVLDVELAKDNIRAAVPELVDQLALRTELMNPVPMTAGEISSVLDYEMRRMDQDSQDDDEFIERETKGMTRQ